MQLDSHPRHVISQRAKPRFAWRTPAGGLIGLVLLLGLPLALTGWGILDSIASVHERMRDPLQALLYPSGFPGQRFGIIGLGSLCFVCLYPMHRKIEWPGLSASHAEWMNVLAGESHPHIQPNDHAIVCAGGDTPVGLLEQRGVPVARQGLVHQDGALGGRARGWEPTVNVGAEAPRAACTASSARCAADGTAHVPGHARPAREASRV